MVCTWCQKWWGLCVKKLIARGMFKIRWLCCLREDTQLECHARRRLWSLQVETDVEHSGPHDYVGQTLRRFDWQHAVLLHFEVISHYAKLNGTADQMTLCERGFSCGESKLLWSPVLPLLLQASHPLAFFLSFFLSMSCIYESAWAFLHGAWHAADSLTSFAGTAAHPFTTFDAVWGCFKHSCWNNDC